LGHCHKRGLTSNLVASPAAPIRVVFDTALWGVRRLATALANASEETQTSPVRSTSPCTVPWPVSAALCNTQEGR
jgi:hypothetical protein